MIPTIFNNPPPRGIVWSEQITVPWLCRIFGTTDWSTHRALLSNNAEVFQLDYSSLAGTVALRRRCYCYHLRKFLNLQATGRKENLSTSLFKWQLMQQCFQLGLGSIPTRLDTLIKNCGDSSRVRHPSMPPRRVCHTQSSRQRRQCEHSTNIPKEASTPAPNLKAVTRAQLPVDNVHTECIQIYAYLLSV